MLKGLFGLISLMLVAGSLAHAQQTANPGINQADLKALTDARIGVLKAALQLTPDQAGLWPPVEEAMRARAQTRYGRIAAVADQLSSGREVDPIALFRGRAEALAQRSVELNKLVDAWEPLYRSLAPDQKERLRFMAARIVPALSAAIDTRRLEAYDEDDNDVYIVYFGNSPGGTQGIAPR
jgi:LTXXQ motif family protein